MSGESGEKTEEPSQKKLRDAREKGQVAKSKDVASTFTMLGVVVILWTLGDWYMKSFVEIFLLPSYFYSHPFMEAFKTVLFALLHKMLLMLSPLVAIAALGAILGNVFQFGFLIAFESIKPDIKKINPVQGAKKIFSIKNLVEFIKSIIKVLFVSFVVYSIIKNHLNDLVNMPWCGSSCILPVAGALLKKLILYTLIAFIIISLFDFIFEKKQFTKEQRMTKSEVQREQKELDGNPEIKGRRRELHQELINSEDNVKKSNVIIKNPTHIAVGLYYDSEETPLPVITSLGKRSQAQMILKIAESYNIPVMENVPLAQALYKQTEVGSFIPNDLIGPVAEVFRWVQQLKNEPE